MQTWQKLKQNPDLFPRYFVKEYILRAVRHFFEDRGYHELESPIITSALPQERYLEILETSIDQKHKSPLTAYLIPSTETFNKKILAAGLGQHFVITKVFRGLEDIGPNHSPEFTMLEWYHLNTDYFGLMEDTEQLFLAINGFLQLKLTGREGNIITYQGQEIDLTPPWDRLSISEALEKFCGLKFAEIQTLDQIKTAAAAKGYQIDDTDDWQTLFELIFANEIEPNLNPAKPTFVYAYPRILCPLTKINEENPLVSEKVELYIAGKEIANGYTELLDWQEQERRFLEEQEARVTLGKRAVKMDTDLIEALKSGLPPVSGIGLGIDRVAMIFADAQSIADINYFPASEMFAETE